MCANGGVVKGKFWAELVLFLNTLLLRGRVKEGPDG